MDCERRLRTATHPGIQPEAGVRWNFRPTRGEPPNPREPRRGWILLKDPSTAPNGRCLSYWPLPSLLAAALLVFFAAAAGADVVAAHTGNRMHRLRLGQHFVGFAHQVAGLRHRGWILERGCRLVGGRLRQVVQELLESHEARGAAEDVVADLRLDVDHQGVEQLEGLGLVLDERVPLAVGAQTDGVAQ